MLNFIIGIVIYIGLLAVFGYFWNRYFSKDLGSDFWDSFTQIAVVAFIVHIVIVIGIFAPFFVIFLVLT